MSTISNAGKNIQSWPSYDGSIVRLNPGQNQVTERHFDFLMKHPVFKDFVEKGILSVQKDLTDLESEKKAKIKDQEKKELEEKTSQTELIKQIVQMDDVEALQKIVDTDKRPKIVEFAKKQIKVMSE